MPKTKKGKLIGAQGKELAGNRREHYCYWKGSTWLKELQRVVKKSRISKPHKEERSFRNFNGLRMWDRQIGRVCKGHEVPTEER